MRDRDGDKKRGGEKGRRDLRGSISDFNRANRDIRRRLESARAGSVLSRRAGRSVVLFFGPGAIIRHYEEDEVPREI